MADGSVVRGGGKVVKNVAGYNLPKLFIGSFGTLGVIVEATVKIRPRPDVDRLVVARFHHLKDAGGAAARHRARTSCPRRSSCSTVRRSARPARARGRRLLIGVDSIAEQVDLQCAEASRLLPPLSLVAARVLDGPARDEVWRARGALACQAFGDIAAVMKWGVLPSQLAEVLEQGGAIAQRNGLRAAMAAHAGVGIASAVLSVGGGYQRRGGGATDWRAMVAGAGGHALISGRRSPSGRVEGLGRARGRAARIMKGLKRSSIPAAS
jgi:glycolate oxidase